MKTRIIIFAVLLFGFSATALAQTPTPGVSQSQVHQQKRIKKGVKSGELTPAEYAQIRKQHRHINRSKKAAKADGVVTRRERAALHQQQKNASANIYRKKHNGRNRN